MIVRKRILILAAFTMLALAACNDDGGSEGETTDVIDSANTDSQDDDGTTPDSADSTSDSDDTTDTEDGSPPTPAGTPNIQYSYTTGNGSTELKEAWIPSGDAPAGYTSVELGSFECEQNGSDVSVIVTATDGTSEIGRIEFDIKRTVELDVKASVIQFRTSAPNGGFVASSDVYCYESVGIGVEPGGTPNEITCEAYGDSEDEYLDVKLNFDIDEDCSGLEPADWQCIDTSGGDSANVSCDEFGRSTTCEDISGCASPSSCIVQDASYCEAFPSAQGCFNASDSNCNWIFANNRCEQSQPMSPAECDTSDRDTCLNSGCQWLGAQPCTGTIACGDLNNNRTLCRYAADCEVVPADEGPIRVIR